jgi:hypothetical protein
MLFHPSFKRRLGTMNPLLVSSFNRLRLSLTFLLVAVGCSRTPTEPPRQAAKSPTVEIPSEVLQKHQKEFSLDRGRGVLAGINIKKNSAGKDVAAELIMVGGLNTDTIAIKEKGFEALGIQILQRPNEKTILGTSRNGVAVSVSSIPLVGWNDTGSWRPLPGKVNFGQASDNIVLNETVKLSLSYQATSMTINGTHGILHYGLLPEPGQELKTLEILRQYCGQQPKSKGEVPILYYEPPKNVVIARLGLTTEGLLEFEPFTDYVKASGISLK